MGLAVGKGLGSNRPYIVQLVSLEAGKCGDIQPASGKHDSLKWSNSSSPPALPDSPIITKKCVPPKKSSYERNTHNWELLLFFRL